MDRPHREAAVRRVLAWLGAATAVVGIIGLLLVPSAYVVWVFLIAFGVATQSRAGSLRRLASAATRERQNDQSHDEP